jgi:hypothetical protein
VQGLSGRASHDFPQREAHPKHEELKHLNSSKMVSMILEKDSSELIIESTNRISPSLLTHISTRHQIKGKVNGGRPYRHILNGTLQFYKY